MMDVYKSTAWKKLLWKIFAAPKAFILLTKTLKKNLKNEIFFLCTIDTVHEDVHKNPERITFMQVQPKVKCFFDQ